MVLVIHLFLFFLFSFQVRGVGTGGIVSTAFCLLYKLFTLKLTRKQLMGLITHTDSPYIRALGFMYIRYALFICLTKADAFPLESKDVNHGCF